MERRTHGRTDHTMAVRDTQITEERPVLDRVVPGEVFSDPARFTRELDEVFAVHWLVAARADEIPQPGALPREVAGRPIVLTRDEAGAIAAFHNVCQHRGALVVAQAIESTRLRCRFHGWTYGLAGQLEAVPRQSRFADLDRSTCPLPAIEVESWGGWVWVRLGDGPPLAEWLGPWADELARYRPETMQRWAARVDDVELNWKATIDAFNETYHVAFVHPQTVGQLVDGAATSFRYAGAHSRMVIPVRRDRRGGDGERGDRRSEKDLLPEQRRDHCNYTLFPNTIFNLLSTWGITLRFEPITVTTTRIHADMLVDPTTDEHARRGYADQWEQFSRVLDEDLDSLGLVGRGMRSPAFQQVRFGGEEERLAHFHDEVTASLP